MEIPFRTGYLISGSYTGSDLPSDDGGPKKTVSLPIKKFRKRSVFLEKNKDLLLHMSEKNRQ